MLRGGSHTWFTVQHWGDPSILKRYLEEVLLENGHNLTRLWAWENDALQPRMYSSAYYKRLEKAIDLHLQHDIVPVVMLFNAHNIPGS